MAGVYDAEVPPVPIPNTEVKLSGAENTWRVTSREDRSMPAPQKQRPLGVAFLFSARVFVRIPMGLLAGIPGLSYTIEGKGRRRDGTAEDFL